MRGGALIRPGHGQPSKPSRDKVEDTCRTRGKLGRSGSPPHAPDSAALAALLHGADSWLAWPRGVTLATSPAGQLMTSMAQHRHARYQHDLYSALQGETEKYMWVHTYECVLCGPAVISSSVCSHVATCPPFHCVILTIVGTYKKQTRAKLFVLLKRANSFPQKLSLEHH